MINRLLVVALCVGAVFLARPVHAGPILYTNLGAGGTYNAGIAYIVGAAFGADTDVAAPFTPSTTASLGSLQLAVYQFMGQNLYDIWLMSDAAGTPGTIIETMQSAFPTGIAPPVTTVNSVLMPLLTAGTQYWVVVSGANTDTRGGWYWNSTGDIGLAARVSTFNNGGWMIDNVSPAPALQVTGAELTPVPEPVSMLLLGTGLAAVAAKARRRRKE